MRFLLKDAFYFVIVEGMTLPLQVTWKLLPQQSAM